jgi:hypothetical protein
MEVKRIMLDEIKNVISNNSFDSIYLTGFLDNEDDGVTQFYPDMRFIYFEFGDKIVEFYKFEPINQSSRLRIMIVDSVRHEFDLEDVMPGRIKISEVIFKNPLADNKVSKMHCFNFEENDSRLLCDALHIKLSNGQDIFLDPGFLGINIGGLEVKQVWEENLVNGVLPEEICIEFDNK